MCPDKSHPPVLSPRAYAPVRRSRLCPGSSPGACAGMVYNCFMWCQPSAWFESHGRRLRRSLRSPPSHLFLVWVFQLQVARTNSQKAFFCSGTGHCALPGSLTPPQLSFHIQDRFQTSSKAQNLCLLLPSEQCTPEHQAPAGDEPLAQRDRWTQTPRALWFFPGLRFVSSRLQLNQMTKGV